VWTAAFAGASKRCQLSFPAFFLGFPLLKGFGFADRDSVDSAFAHDAGDGHPAVFHYPIHGVAIFVPILNGSDRLHSSRAISRVRHDTRQLRAVLSPWYEKSLFEGCMANWQSISWQSIGTAISIFIALASAVFSGLSVREANRAAHEAAARNEIDRRSQRAFVHQSCGTGPFQARGGGGLGVHPNMGKQRQYPPPRWTAICPLITSRHRKLFGLPLANAK